MATLESFLHPAPIEETREVKLERFADPFVIKSITQAQNEALVKQCKRQVKSPNGQYVEQFDGVKYSNLLITTCCVTPDFNQSDLLAAFGALRPEECPSKMLKPGESAKLSGAILELLGFGGEEELEEAKKS